MASLGHNELMPRFSLSSGHQLPWCDKEKQTGPRLNIKTVFSGMGLHYNNKTVVRQFYHHIGNLYTGKTISLYQDGPLVLVFYKEAFQKSTPSWRHEMIENVTIHYSDVITGSMASQITSLTIVYATVYSGADQRKHQSSASLAFVRGIHRGPVNSLRKWPVTRKMFPFDDVIMI